MAARALVSDFSKTRQHDQQNKDHRIQPAEKNCTSSQLFAFSEALLVMMVLGSSGRLRRVFLLSLILCWVAISTVGLRTSRVFAPLTPLTIKVRFESGSPMHNYVPAIYMTKNGDEVVKPLLKRRSLFSEDQDAKLVQFLRDCVAKNRKVSWDELALYVGGERSAAQCSDRWKYLCSRDPDSVADIVAHREIFIRSDFSLNEDSLLVEAVESFIDLKRKVSWGEVANKLGTRNSLQCHDRLKYLLSIASPTVDVSRINQNAAILFRDYEAWSSEEDVRLLEAMRNPVLRSGGVFWQPVADYVGTRSAMQCKGRWQNMQANNPEIATTYRVIKRVPLIWSAEEDERLISLVLATGRTSRFPWKQIAEEMSTRNADACKGHWAVLKARGDVPEAPLVVTSVQAAAVKKSVKVEAKEVKEASKVEVNAPPAVEPEKEHHVPQTPRKSRLLLSATDILKQSISALLGGPK